VLVDSQQRHGVVIVGPVADDPSWQARFGNGFTKAQFQVDWDRQVVTCPEGKQSISWLPSTYPKSGMDFEARFARKDCTPCPMRSRCTRAKDEPRIIGLQARENYEALQSARRHQTTDEFQKNYAARAGIEGTHAQAISRCGLRRCRYIGLAKTHLQHVIIAAAVNLVRIADWHNAAPRTPKLRDTSAFLPVSWPCNPRWPLVTRLIVGSRPESFVHFAFTRVLPAAKSAESDHGGEVESGASEGAMAGRAAGEADIRAAWRWPRRADASRRGGWLAGTGQNRPRSPISRRPSHAGSRSTASS
jgi:Transposase DDE domain